MQKTGAGLFPFKKWIAGFVTVVFIGTTICQPWAEASFWGDRRKARDQFTQARQGGEQAPLLLASANLGSALGDARPIHVEPTAADVSRLSGPLLQSPLLRSLPYANISVRDAYLPSSHPPQLIIHIQDVHANLEAQKNIASSLVSLGESTSTHGDGPRLLVGLEGAEGPFIIDALRTFPDKEILNEGADVFLKKDLLTGAEYAALTSRRGLDLWGVENRALYNRHVKAVVDATPLESSFRKTLNDFGTRTRALKDKEYNDALKAWDKEYENYHGERSSLGAYVRHIAQGEKRGAFPQVERFLGALDTEEKLDFPQAERERKVLVEALAARLTPQDLAALTERAVAFRAGQMGFGAFHNELIALADKAGVTMKGSKEFLRYLEYVKLVESIDRNGLLDEIDGQEKAYVARLLKSASVKAGEVYAVSRDLVMADKLLRHALTPNEWTEYGKNADSLRNLPDQLSKLETGQPVATNDFVAMIPVFEEFYRAGVARNKVLVDNLFARMGQGSDDGKEPAVAVLVAGGFHTDGVTSLIKERGAAYVTLTPRFEVVNGQDSLDVFRQQKTPLDRLFAGEKLNLVEGLAGASSALQGGNDRGTLLRTIGVSSLLVSSTLGAETLDSWLAAVKQNLPGFVYERRKSEGQSGYLTTLPDGRQIFVWETETPGAFKWVEFKNGVVNTRAYTPTLLARIPSFFTKFTKGRFLTGKSVAIAVVVGGALFSFPMLTISNVAGILLLTSLYLVRHPIQSFIASRGTSSAGLSQETKPAENGPAVAAILPLMVAGALWLAAIYFGIPLLADQLTGWQAALNAIAGSDISTFVGAIAFFGGKLVGVFGALVSLTPTVAMLTGLAVLGRLALSFPAGQKIFSRFVPKSPVNAESLAESTKRGTSELKQGKIVSGVTHLLVDVMGTLYNFAFVQADRAFQLMVNGKLPESVLAASPLTYTEKKYVAFRESLQKQGLSPLLTATISAFALPLIALQGIVVRRLYFMVLSTISNIGLTLATGKILMVIAPVFGFDPVLALATIVGFSLLSSLDLIFGEGWTAQYAQKSEVFRSLVLVASPFAAMNSFFLAFLMTSVKLIKQSGIKPILTGQWWKLAGVQSFQSAFGKSLSFSGVLGSIHMVGFEIAMVKWVAHLTGGPVETVLLAIEGPENSVLGAGNQVASAAGLGDVGSSFTAVTNEGRAYSVSDVQSLSAQGLPRISWAMQRLEQNPNDPVAREVLAGEPATVIANLTRHIAELPASVRGPLETLAKKPADVQARLAVQSTLQGIIAGTVDVGDSKEVVGLIAHGLPLMADLQRQGRATGARDQQQLAFELKGWGEKGGAALLLAGPREHAPSVNRWEQIKSAWGKIGTAHAAEIDRSVGPETPPSAPQTQGPVETVVAAGARSLENILPGAEAGKTPGTVEVTVQKGMTVGGIVRALTLAGALLPGVATAADMKAAIQNTNGLSASYLIKEGQRLVIPLDPAALVRATSPPSAATETASVSAPEKAALPDLPGADSGPARGVPIDTLADVSRLVKQSLVSQRDAAKSEADRLREQAEHPLRQVAPGAGVGAHVGGGESGVSVEVASRLRSDSLARYAEAKRWADFTDADMELMARDRTRQAGEALLSYRSVSETLKIKRESLRAMEAIPQQGTPESQANLTQALKSARDDVRLLEKAEQEAARAAKNLLGLRVKDDVRVKGGFFVGAEGQNLDVYEARIKANSAKIHALAQELGTEGADEVARFFKDTLRIEASASWFNESGSKPLPQLGLSLDLRALDKGDVKKEFAERVQKAVELFNLKVANEQLRVEAAQAKDHAVQQLKAIRENAKEARIALAAAEEFLKDQSANYTTFNGAETEGSGLVRAIRLREEALARVLAVQTAEVQARTQFRFAGGTGDPESVAPVSAPLRRDEVAKLEISRLIDTAIKQRLGFSEKDIENAAHDGGWVNLAGKINANLRVNGTFYKGGSPVAVTFGVLLRDSNAETKGERAQLSLARAEMLVKAARNQVVNEVTSSYLALRDAQEAQRLATESQGLQDKLVPTDSAHASYFDRKAQSAAGRARLFDAKTNELNAWRSLQSSVGVDPTKAGDTFRGLTGSVAHDPTHAVEVSKGYYDPKADKALASVMQVRIAELGLKMATNTDQYWDPKIGFAVTPTGGVVPLIWTDRLANIPAAILSPLTWPFRAANGDTRFFISPLDDRINAETKLAEGEVVVSQEDKDFQQSQKKVEAVGAAEALEKAEARVKRAEARLGRAAGDLKQVEERAKQERASSAEVVRQQAALVNLQAIYQEALGDYRRALNRVHGLGLNPGTAALEAKALPALEKENPATQGTVDAKAAQSVDPIKAALGYLKATTPISASSAPGTLFGFTIPGAGIVAGRVEDARKGVGDRKMAAALAAAQKDFVAKSRVYEMVGEFEAIAQRNERLARQFWLNVVAPQVENVFPGNVADLRESKNLANDAARLRDDLGKKTEEARLAVARALGRTPAEADAAPVRSLSGRPPTVRWLGGVGTVSAETHPAVLAAGAEGEAATQLAKANDIARHMPDLSFNIEEVTPSSGGAEKVAPVLRVYMNATPSLEGAVKSEAFKADERAAKLSQADQIRQIENEMDDLAKRISAGSEHLPALYETLQTARKNVGEKVAAYERYGVADTEHAVPLAGFGPVKEATDNYNKALENYAKARADFEQSLARFNNLMLLLGQNPADFLQVVYEENGNPRDLALPPPSKVKDEVKIPFPGLLPGSMSRPGFTFEQRFDKTRAPNDPLADLPTQYVELDLNTGKPTGRVIDARYTVDAKDPARRTTAFIDHRPYGATDPRKTVPPTVSVFSEATLRSNPYNPYTLPDATVGWDREDGWTVQSVTRGRAGRVAVDVVTPDGKHIQDELIRDGQGVRLKNQRTDVRLTKVSLVTDRSGQKGIQKATEMGGRVIWEGQFTERQEPISFVDHRNKTRGRVTGRETLPRGSTMTLPGGGRAALAYGGSVVMIDGVDSQGKPMKTFDVLSDNFSSLGSVTNATVLRRDPAQPDAPAKPAVSASYTRFGDRDAAELREGAAGYQRQGNNVAFTLPEKDPYARLAYRGESVYVLPTRDGGTPGLAFVSPRGGTLSTEVREGVKAAGLKISDPGTLRESMTYGAPLPNGLIPTETRNPKGSPIPGPTAFPSPLEDLMALTKRDQSAKTPEVKEREHPAAQPAKEKLPLWREWLNKVSDFFISKAGASDFEDIRATPKGLLDTDNKPVHLNGVNWRGIQYGWNFGDPGNGFARNKAWMEGELAAMKASGVNAVRIPLLDDGRHLNGDYSNFNQFKGDIQVFLDAAAKQGIHVEFVLFDFLAVGRGKFDMSQRSTENFRTNFLTPFLNEFGRHPALLTIDLINEPEWILDKSVPGGWGDKMEGGRRAVNSQEYQRFVASMSGAIKDSKLKDKDGKPVAGHVLVTVGTSVKHHATATDRAVRGHLDYYSWHHYDWMGSMSDYVGSVPLDNKPFEIGEYATDGTKTTPADYMRIARTNQGGVGAFAWNWGARVGQKIDGHTTANADKLRADLKAAGEVSKDPKAKPVVPEGKPAGSAVKDQGVKEPQAPGTIPTAPGSYRSYRAPDGTTYTPMPDGKTVIRSIGDPFDPANESDQRVISVPAGFDFRDPAALSYLDDPAHVARTLTRGVRYANGLTAVEVHSSAKPREDNLIRVFYQDKNKNTYTQQSDGTWTITPWGAKAPSVVVNPREGFRVDAPDALAQLTAPGNRVGFYTYELASQIERKGKYDIPAPAGTYKQRYYRLDQTGSALDAERPMEVQAYVFPEAARGFAADPLNLLTQALRPNMTPAVAERMDWDLTASLSEPMLYQRERLGLTYDAGSVELILAQKIAASAKISYGSLLVERVQSSQESSFRERHGLGPKEAIPPTLLALQRDEAERRVDEFLMMSAIDLVPSVLARSIKMADKVNANDVREAVTLIREGNSTVLLDGLVARFTLTGSLGSNRAVLDAMESLIKTLSGNLDYQDASQVMQILFHLNTIPFVGTDENGKPAVRPAGIDGKRLVEIIRLAERNATQLRELFLKRYPGRDRAMSHFSSDGLGVLLYWATNNELTPVPLVRKADREKTHPVGPPETMISRSEAIERAKRPSFAYFLQALDTPLFKTFLERWHGDHPSYANFLESATLLTNQMVKNQSVLTPEIMREILARLSNGDLSTVEQEVKDLRRTKDEVRVSRAKEAFGDAAMILLWILVPLGLGGFFKRHFRKKGTEFWNGLQNNSPQETPTVAATTGTEPTGAAVQPEAHAHPSAYRAPEGVDMAPLLTDLSKNLATVGGNLAGDFRKGHQALEQGRFFMKNTAGLRVTISSWRLTNFLSIGAGILIFLAQAYAVANFGSWAGFTNLMWGIGALFFLNGLLGNFLSWKTVGLGAFIILAAYGFSSGSFTISEWTGILVGGTLTSKLKLRTPNPETDWIGARILASWIQSHFPRLALWGWTDWKEEKVDPNKPKPSPSRVAFNWVQKQLGIRFTRLPPRAERQKKMVGTLLGSIDEAQERMALLWVDLSPQLRDDWKREVLFRFGSLEEKIPVVKGGLEDWVEKVNSAYERMFPNRPAPSGISNTWMGAYALLPAGEKTKLIQELETQYGGVVEAYKNSEFLAFSKYLSDIPSSWLAAYSKLGDALEDKSLGDKARASLRKWLDTQVTDRKIDRDSLQAQVRELSRVWAAPPLGLPDEYVYTESIKVDFFEWIDQSKDWLKFLQGKEDTYQIFSRTHYPNYDPQYHDPIFYVRGRNFEVLRRNNGNIYLMPGTHEDHTQGYSRVTDKDRFSYNGDTRYTAHPLRWFSAGIGLVVVGYMAQWPIFTVLGALFVLLPLLNRWRGGWPAVTHPAPLYNIAYYAQMVADRTRTTRDYMSGTVYPINEYRRALLPYRGIVENFFPNDNLAELSDEEFFPRVWTMTGGQSIGTLQVYPTLQAFLDDNLGQSVREEIRRAQAGEIDPARMSFEDAAREEETDRNNMVNTAIAAHKGLQGPGPTNSSQGNTLRQNLLTLVLIAIAFFVLVPVVLSLRLDLIAAVAEGVQSVSTGLFAGVPVVGDGLLAFTNTLSKFVSLENVDFLVFNATGISLFGGITFGMGAFALLMVGMVFKIILFFQGFKSPNRMVDFGFGMGLLGVAGALWFFAPLSWFTTMGAMLFAFVGIGWLLKTSLATRYKEELTNDHIERFVPDHLLDEALASVTDAELTAVGVSREKFNDWLNEFGARGAWRRLAEREDSFLVLIKSSLMGIPNTQRPIHRLRQDDRFNLLKIVYLANVQGPRRKELIAHLIKLYEDPTRRNELNQRMRGSTSAQSWLDRLAQEMETIDNYIGNLGEHANPQDVINTYFEANQRRMGQLNNDDIVSQLSFEDIVELKENRDHESLWPKIILMQTAFGATSEERLFALLESALKLWPSIQVDITLDDNDEDGRNGVLRSMENGRLKEYADRIVISNHAAHGTNLGVGNIHQRHKPMMNAEAVFRLNYRFKKFLGRLPFFQTLVDMEDVFLKEVLDDKMAIWAMRERTINEQLARQESEEALPDFVAGRRWRSWSRTGALVLVVGGMVAALLGFGSAFAAPSVVLVGLSSGSWLGLGGLATSLAGWVYRRRTAERASVDSKQWGIRLDSDALEYEYKKALQGLATAAGLGRNWAKNNFSQSRDMTNSIVSQRNLESTFNELQSAFMSERGFRAQGEITNAETVRVAAVQLAEGLTAEERALYQLWAYAQVFPTFNDFRRQVFRIRNMPDVIQTELRQVPVNAADRRFSELSHIDYLFWHNTIQIGEDASGFMFLGGTGNTFMWELLGGTDDHAYVRLTRMMWPIREANRKEERERPLFLRILLLVPLSLGVLSVVVPQRFRADFENARATWVSSRTLYKYLNRYLPTGVWDKFNIIEDSERGRRSAFQGLTSHRLFGRDKEVLEDALPRLGPKWLNQRQRWIIQQTFFAIIRFLPVGLMFFGQYLGAGLGFALMGDRAHVIQGLFGMGGGFVLGGVAAYLVGLVIFRWLGRAGLIRNTQFYINPLVGLSMDREPGLWRGIVSRVKAYYKFQQISHLAASVPMMMASSVLVTITLLYFLGFFFNVGPVMEFVEGLGIPGLTGFVGMMVVFIQTFFPLIEAVVPTTFWGIFIFLYPPVAMNLMSLVTVLYTSWRDDESIRAAIQTKFTSRVHSFLFLFVSTGMPDAAPFDLGGENPIERTESEILNILRAVEKNSAGQFVPKVRGLNRRILEGFLLNSDRGLNLERLNGIIAELQAIARELTDIPDNALDPIKLRNYTDRTWRLINDQVRPLLVDMRLSEENQNQILDKLLQDQTELEDMALGRLRYGKRTFSAGMISLVAAGVLIWFGWDYPLWLGAFLLALGSALVVISSKNLINKNPAKGHVYEGSVQMRNFAVQAGRSLKMYFYFTFLHPSAWRNFGVAVNSFYKPGANEPFWTRGRDEGLGDLSLWELTPQRRFQIWWAGVRHTVTQYSILPAFILAALPWLVAVGNWHDSLVRMFGVEQVKLQIVTRGTEPTLPNWASWDRAVMSAYLLKPEAFQGWTIAQIEEAGRLYQESKDRDPDMEKRAKRMLDMALFAVRTYADGLSKNTNWNNPIEAQKAVRNYEDVVQSVQQALAGMGQMDRFEKIFPGLPLKPIPILNQFASSQGQLNSRVVVIDVKPATAGRPTDRSVVVKLKIPETNLTGQVVAVASQVWPTDEDRKVEVRVDLVSFPRDGNLASTELQRKDQGASSLRLPIGRDSVFTYLFHSYSPDVLAPNYNSGKVKEVQIVVYTRGPERFEAKMQFDQLSARPKADPRVNDPVLVIARPPTAPNTIEWLWTRWNRLTGREVSVEGMVTDQAPWESYWMVALAGVAVPVLIFLHWSPVFAAGFGVLWGLLHLGGTFDKDLKPISGFKALLPSLGRAAVAAVAVGFFAVGLDFLLSLSPLSEYLARLALFDGLVSLSQLSLISNVFIALPVSLFVAGPFFKYAHQTLNKRAVVAAQQRQASQAAIPLSEMADAIGALETQPADTKAMGSFLTAVLEKMPLVSLDVSSQVDPLVLRGRLVQSVPGALEAVGSRFGGRVGAAVEPSVPLGRMLASGVKGQAFDSAVGEYAFALGYQMARSDNPAALVSLLEVAYLTVASRSAEVGVHMNPNGFAQAFQLGATFAQETVGVRENEAPVFHIGSAEREGKGENAVLEQFVATLMANARAEAAGQTVVPIELVSSESSVTTPETVLGAVRVYVQKNYPSAMNQLDKAKINVRLRNTLPFKGELIDSEALFSAIKRQNPQVTGLAAFTDTPESWAKSDLARIIPLEKVLGEVLQRLNAMRATDDNA